MNCYNCFNYKTRVVTDAEDDRLDSISTVRKFRKSEGRARVFYCTIGGKAKIACKGNFPHECARYESMGNEEFVPEKFVTVKK